MNGWANHVKSFCFLYMSKTLLDLYPEIENPLKWKIGYVLGIGTENSKPERMSVLVCIGVLLPFPFYCFLWTYPQIWVDFCGKGSDPCHRMAQVSHFLKLLQFLAIFSVAHFSWPPWYCFLPFALGQFLNFRWVFSIWVWLGFLIFAYFWLISPFGFSSFWLFLN